MQNSRSVFASFRFCVLSLLIHLEGISGVSTESEFLGGKNEISNVQYTGSLSDQKIRLRGQNRLFGSGRIEIYYRRRWNLVCNKFFTQKEADVTCRWLGFRNGAKSFSMGPKYGSGFFLDLMPYKFNCQGSEASLFTCNKSLENIICDPVKHTLTVECRLNYNSYCARNEVAFDRLCYVTMTNRSYNFREAQLICESSGGTLVQIQNRETMNFLSELLTTLAEDRGLSGLWYTAGYRLNDHSRWKWFARVSVEASRFLNWKPGFRDDARNNCIVLKKDELQSSDDYFFWETIDCSLPANFICQKSLNFDLGCLDLQNARVYNGLSNITTDDNVCKKWNDPLVLKKHSIFPNQALVDHNYCRNPDGGVLPWCFTDSVNVSHCDVPTCRSKSSKMCDDNEMQCGDKNICVPLDFVCDRENDCGNEVDEVGCYDCGKKKPIRLKRGVAQDDIFKTTFKIVGGHETNPTDYPWVVSIKWNGKHYCGGAIIDRLRILTAAHCFDQGNSKADFIVVVGEWDNTVFDGHEVALNISRIIQHPEYNGKANDIALIELDAPLGLTYNDYVQPICLSTNYTPVDINVTCSVAGWGSLGEDLQTEKQFPRRLQAAQIPIISRQECAELSAYGNTVPQQAFCAGFLNGGVDSCKGDSGSPLVCRVKDRYYLFGIASRGWECAKPNKPGIYTSVRHYVKWIRRQILNNV